MIIHMTNDLSKEMKKKIKIYAYLEKKKQNRTPYPAKPCHKNAELITCMNL